MTGINADNTRNAQTLKESIFSEARVRHIADACVAIVPKFDRAAFMAAALHEWAALSVMQRLRRISQSLQPVLPQDYTGALEVLYQLAPRVNNRFVTMVLPDYVALYGRHEFERSMAALKTFTTFGSSEFAVRQFLLDDRDRTLAAMRTWASDSNEHVRRLASEGSRPRLPWSFRLPRDMADPSLTAPILDALNNDPSAYVRTSVANHLNDITKERSDWVMDHVTRWPLEQPWTMWIVRHALRSEIKKANPDALALLKAEPASIRADHVNASPSTVKIGMSVLIDMQITSTSDAVQKLIVDYAVHYVKKSGATSRKVFKWRTLSLGSHRHVTLKQTQRIHDFTTRRHYAGHHRIDIIVNGEIVAQTGFDLQA